MDPCQRREKESLVARSRGRYSPAPSCWSVAKNSTGMSVPCMSFHEPLASAMSCLQSWRCSLEWVCMRAEVAHCCSCRSLVSVDLSVVEQPLGCFSALPKPTAAFQRRHRSYICSLCGFLRGCMSVCVGAVGLWSTTVYMYTSRLSLQPCGCCILCTLLNIPPRETLSPGARVTPFKTLWPWMTISPDQCHRSHADQSKLFLSWKCGETSPGCSSDAFHHIKGALPSVENVVLAATPGVS